MIHNGIAKAKSGGKRNTTDHNPGESVKQGTNATNNNNNSLSEDDTDIVMFSEGLSLLNRDTVLWIRDVIPHQ